VKDCRRESPRVGIPKSRRAGLRAKPFFTSSGNRHNEATQPLHIIITLGTAFCVDCLEEALKKYGNPEIFNTDQGCQFTSERFTSVLKAHSIAISKNRGSCEQD